MKPPRLLELLVSLMTLGGALCSGDTVNLTCQESDVGTQYHQYRFWLLPTGVMLYPNVEGNEQVVIVNSGRVLTVKNTSEQSSRGTYYCLVYVPWRCQFKVGSKHTIDGDGEYHSGNHEERFYTKLMGATAFGVLSVICIVLVIVVIWTNRNVIASPAAAPQANALPPKGASSRCCINFAFMPDGTGCCRKPPIPAYPVTQVCIGKEPPLGIIVGSGEGGYPV